jgi:gliding motility associated protien GldN
MKLIKFLICCCLVLIFSTNTIHAQTNILNTNKVENIGKKTVSQIKVDSLDTPLPYGYTSNDDVLWSKVVWEIIDLNQKINHPYYYPTDLNSIGTDRLSLFNTLQTAVNSSKLEIYEDAYFKEKRNVKELKSIMKKICNNGLPSTIEPKDITQFMIKGMWYFDKRQGELKYRLLGIAPLYGFDAGTKCENEVARNQWENDNPQLSVEDYPRPKLEKMNILYWVFYPESRQILHDSKVFNPDNSVSPITFDHLLNSRRFSSVIVREENVYQNRSIDEYTKNSIFQLLEAEKIKESIRNKEIDMWNY